MLGLVFADVRSLVILWLGTEQVWTRFSNSKG